MTRARTASNGLGTPPPLDRWIEAVLMLCVSLVQGARTTLGMIYKRNHRDWHTAEAQEDLPQATSGIHLKESDHPRGVATTATQSLSFRASRRRDPEPRGDAHNRQRTQFLGSHSRQFILSLSKDASGMTESARRPTIRLAA